MFRHEYDRLVAPTQIRAHRRTLVRDRLAWCYERVEIMRLLGLRILTQYLRDGDLGPAASISKLYWSEYHQVAANLAMEIMGPAGLVPSGHVPPRPTAPTTRRARTPPRPGRTCGC
jgi:alkylation response protein AidB-like acyl-CoA dehydrogenase